MNEINIHVNNVLKEKCDNNQLQNFLKHVFEQVESMCQCKVETFNLVLSNEYGITIISHRDDN